MNHYGKEIWNHNVPLSASMPITLSLPIYMVFIREHNMLTHIGESRTMNEAMEFAISNFHTIHLESN